MTPGVRQFVRVVIPATLGAGVYQISAFIDTFFLARIGTGSLSYLAPELITRKDAGPAADVYGLGILLYEMLTGGIPGRRSPLPSEINSEVPSKLDPIFDKMTQDRRESRYPDFDAMLDEFYGAFSDGEFLHRGDLVLSSEAPGA